MSTTGLFEDTRAFGSFVFSGKSGPCQRLVLSLLLGLWRSDSGLVLNENPVIQ